MINGSKSEVDCSLIKDHISPLPAPVLFCVDTPGKFSILSPQELMVLSPYLHMSYQSYPHPSLTWVWSRLSPAHLSFRNKSVKVQHHFQNLI